MIDAMMSKWGSVLPHLTLMIPSVIKKNSNLTKREVE